MAGALLSLAGALAASPLPAAASRPVTAPVFASSPVAHARATYSFRFDVRVKAYPTASITATTPLPHGLALTDNGNDTATLAGAVPLSGTYSIGLHAANSAGAADQALVLTVTSTLPPIRHIFVVVLENLDFSSTFGSKDPYLGQSLPSQGALLKHYYGVGHFSNDNYTGLISGQPPNSDNQFDCLNYVDFPSGLGQDANGIQQGAGCVYPSAVTTVANQMTGEGLTWKGYMEDMGKVPSREAPVCAHPALGSSDHTQSAVAGDGYATRHNPFAYFHSIIDDTASCDRDVVPLGTTSGSLPAGTPAGVTGLATDLKSVSTTPNLSFITPNLCDDGHDYPCVNQPSGSSAVADIDAFLQTWVPLIESSPAFKQDGLLIVTTDEAEQPTLDTTSCCGETPGPAATKGQNGINGPGGGLAGAVLVSPFIQPGRIVTKALNHYSTLASIEDLYGLPRLGEAKTVTTDFDTGVYTR